MRVGTKIGDVVMGGLLVLGLALGVTDVVRGSMQANSTYSVCFNYEGHIADFSTNSREKEDGSDPMYINCTSADNNYAQMMVKFAYWDPDYGVVHNNGGTTYLQNGWQQWVVSNIPDNYMCVPYGQLLDDGWGDEPEEGCYFVGRWRPDSSVIDNGD